MAEKIEAKHYTYDPLSMRNKSHTYDVIGHMVWQPYWIYPKTYKSAPHKRCPGEGLQSLIALFVVLGFVASVMAVLAISTQKNFSFNLSCLFSSKYQTDSDRSV